MKFTGLTGPAAQWEPARAAARGVRAHQLQAAQADGPAPGVEGPRHKRVLLQDGVSVHDVAASHQVAALTLLLLHHHASWSILAINIVN